jgi:hypothetical protein
VKAISLADADPIYACSDSTQIHSHAIQCSDLKNFCSNLDRLERSLGELNEDQYWITYLRQVRRYRFQLCATPLTPDQQGKSTLELVTGLRYHLRHCSEVYSAHLARLAHDILDKAEVFAQANSNPLLDAVTSISHDNNEIHRALLVKESRLVPFAEAALASHATTRQTEVITPPQLDSGRCFTQMIIAGPAQWYSNAVFSAPRATRLDIVRFSWIRDGWRPKNAFLGSMPASRNQAIHDLGGPVGVTGGDEIWLEPEGLLLSRSLVDALTESSHTPGDNNGGDEDMVDARGYYLASGMAVFLEVAEKASVLTIDPNEEDRHRFKRIKIGEIEPGVYILLRTAGTGDYVVPVADRLMGRAAKHARERQRYWKDKLRAVVDREGLLATSVLLLDHGSQVANEQNVRNWMSYRNIRTQDKRDFIAIMRAAGLEAETEQLWQEMGRIHAAHMKAGMEIRRLLLKQATTTDFAELEHFGRMEFALPGADTGSLTAFRIDKISNETALVPEHHLGRPFEAGV